MIERMLSMILAIIITIALCSSRLKGYITLHFRE